MSHQSTRHIMMVEPADFQSNPQTLDTNSFQEEQPPNLAAVQEAAVNEFRAFRDALVAKGVFVTTIHGQKGCPDEVFCNNWVSTHGDGKFITYPLLATNRAKERREDVLKFLGGTHPKHIDLSGQEKEGKFLESTGSIVMDRVNQVAYAAISERTNPDVLAEWQKMLDVELVTFRTHDHTGQPIYHTNVMMFMGSGYAGICLSAIHREDRERVANKLAETHEIIDLEMNQLLHFCGNSLEVLGADDKPYLAMSSAAWQGFYPEQIKTIEKYTGGVIHAEIATIEAYGGGSARCMLLEVF